MLEVQLDQNKNFENPIWGHINPLTPTGHCSDINIMVYKSRHILRTAQNFVELGAFLESTLNSASIEPNFSFIRPFPAEIWPFQSRQTIKKKVEISKIFQALKGYADPY